MFTCRLTRNPRFLGMRRRPQGCVRVNMNVSHLLSPSPPISLSRKNVSRILRQMRKRPPDRSALLSELRRKHLLFACFPGFANDRDVEKGTASSKEGRPPWSPCRWARCRDDLHRGGPGYLLPSTSVGGLLGRSPDSSRNLGRLPMDLPIHEAAAASSQPGELIPEGESAPLPSFFHGGLGKVTSGARSSRLHPGEDEGFGHTHVCGMVHIILNIALSSFDVILLSVE